MSERTAATRLAALIVGAPLLVGVVLGLGAPATPAPHQNSAVQIALHNLAIGWLITLGGVLTAGVVTVLLSATGWLSNGIVIGTAFSSAGLEGLAPLTLSALPELFGFVLFTAGGLLSSIVLWRMVGGTAVQLDVVAIHSVKLAALGTVFLLVAAPLEVIGGKL